MGISVYLNSVGDNLISKYKLCHEKKKLKIENYA